MVGLKHIIISKMNQIGDVTFALPLATMIKKAIPNVQVTFMGRAYTRSLIEQYRDVDGFIDGEALEKEGNSRAVHRIKSLNADAFIHVYSSKKIIKLVKAAGIPIRIGNMRRLFHWQYCNKLVWVQRKGSPLHEMQLDLQFLKGLGLKKDYSLEEIIAKRASIRAPKSEQVKRFLNAEKFNLVIHPKTRGEHIEWPLKDFAALIKSLDMDKFNILITGSIAEREKVAPFLLEPFPFVVDAMNLSLENLLGVISHSDGLIAASTGPVHLAANAGINTLGLYAPIKPFDAGRWGPVGAKASVLAKTKDCNFCRDGRQCQCIAKIPVSDVEKTVQLWYSQYLKTKPQLCDVN